MSHAGQGSAVLTWADLQAWSDGTGIEFLPWQRRILRKLSAEYLTESQNATDRARMCPFISDSAKHVISVADSMRAAVRAMAND